MAENEYHQDDHEEVRDVNVLTTVAFVVIMGCILSLVALLAFKVGLFNLNGFIVSHLSYLL